MRLTKRYIFAGIFLTSFFWIIVDYTAILWNRKKISEEVIVDPRNNADNNIDTTNLVNVDYFKRFYHYVLAPQPGSAGMDGSAVKNPASEKTDEDKRMFDYGFNELSSSKISLERSIPDNRDAA